MKTKRSLIMIVVSLIVILLSVPVPAFAKPFKGLVPMAVDGLCVGATNLDVAVVAVATDPVGVVLQGAEYVCIGGDAVIKTGCMLTKMTADGLWTAGTNLDVAVVAVVTKPVETVFGGVNLLFRGGGGIFKCVFGP